MDCDVLGPLGDPSPPHFTGVSEETDYPAGNTVNVAYQHNVQNNLTVQNLVYTQNGERDVVVAQV